MPSTHELIDWLAEVDGALSCLREREAVVYYEADVAGQLDVDELTCLARERRSLLLDPDVTTRAGLLACGAGAAVDRRKGQLLRLQVLTTRIDEDAELLALRHELEQAQHSFGDRLGAADGVRDYLAATEGCRRARLRAANQVARREGFRGYPDAKLASQELTGKGLGRTLAAVLKAFSPGCSSVLSDIGAGGLSFIDLDTRVSDYLSCAGDAFPPDRQDAAVRSTLSAFGREMETLPLSIERRALPYPGAVHALSIGRDVRLLLSTGNTGLAAYTVMLHELGHALYYCCAPDSVLLLDGRIAREGLAELWAGFLERQEWLRRFTDLADGEIQELLVQRRKWHAYNNVVLAQWALFELRLYEDPDAGFLDVWRDVTQECLGIEPGAEIYPPFVFVYPLDIKDYIYAHLIRTALTRGLEGQFGSSLLRTEVFDAMADGYYRCGNLVPWHDKLPGFDGEGAPLPSSLS